MDLKNILQEEVDTSIKEVVVDETDNNIRVHKKPIQLRDIENRSAGNKITLKLNESEQSMKHLLNREKKESMKVPWNKLDKGMRINRLKLFIKSQVKVNDLSSIDEELLSSIIMKAYNSNKINKNNDVKYNIETCEIESIKELSYDETTNKYNLQFPDVKKTKVSTKSRSNIDRFLKKN
jgi:hypothetical protein